MSRQSSVRAQIDSELDLLPDGMSPITATSSGASPKIISLDKLFAYWNSEDQAMRQQIAVVFSVLNIDFSDTDEQYILGLEVANDAAFTSPVFVISTEIRGVGQTKLEIPREIIKQKASDAQFIRTSGFLSGTTPSITYSAWVAPVIGQ